MAYNILCCQNITELASRRGNANPLIGTILGVNYPLDEAFAVYEWRNTDMATPDGFEIIASTSGDTTIGRWYRVDSAQLPQVNSDWNASSGPAAILNKPTIPSAQVQVNWTATSGITSILNKPTLFSGAYTDLTGKPTYAAVAISGAYSDLTGRPTLSTVATSGLYADLLSKPTLSTVASTGAYNDLTGKPTIPSAQVNSDWTASTGISQILNKPVLATVATSGLYSDLSGKPTLATVATSGAYGDITGKPALSTVATSGSYNDLTNKPTLATMSFAAPVARTLSKATAYQATDNTKASVVTINLTSTSSYSLSGTVTGAASIFVGATSAVASGTGTNIAKYKNAVGGALTVGLANSNSSTQAYTIALPAGWYFAVIDTSTGGGSVTIDTTFDQVVG